MEHSEEYYQQKAFVTLAEAYKEIPKNGITPVHGLILCPYCKNAARNTTDGYKCQDYSCPICMMGIWLAGDVDAPEPELAEAVESIVIPSKKEKPKKRAYRRVAPSPNGGNNYVGGMPPALVRQYKHYVHTEDPAYRAAFYLAKTGIQLQDGNPFCPYCGTRVHINSSKPNVNGVRKRCYKCTNEDCILCNDNIVIHTFERTETGEYVSNKDEFYTDENICLAVGVESIPEIGNKERRVEPVPAPPPEISMEVEAVPVPRPTISATPLPVPSGVPAIDPNKQRQHIVYNRRLRHDERKKARKSITLISQLQDESIQKALDTISKDDDVSTYVALKRFTYSKYISVYRKIWKNEKVF